MTHAERCPICLGSGKISTESQTSAGDGIQCHGCFGRGWVEVSDPILQWTYPQRTILAPDQGMY